MPRVFNKTYVYVLKYLLASVASKWARPSYSAKNLANGNEVHLLH